MSIQGNNMLVRKCTAKAIQSILKNKRTEDEVTLARSLGTTVEYIISLQMKQVQPTTHFLMALIEKYNVNPIYILTGITPIHIDQSLKAGISSNVVYLLH